MKKFLILSLSALALTFTACGGNTEKKEAAASAVEASSAKAVSNAPVMTFNKTIHDFEPSKKENVLRPFSHLPIQENLIWLLLMRAEAVVVLFLNIQRHPIAPGATGQIRESFDSATNLAQQKTLPFLQTQIQVVKPLVKQWFKQINQQQREAAAAARLQQN